MKRLSSAKRVPRKIGADDEGVDSSSTIAQAEQEGMHTVTKTTFWILRSNPRFHRSANLKPLAHVEIVVKRPVLSSKSSSKARLPTSRLAFGGSDATEDDSTNDSLTRTPAISAPKKAAGLSRLALERSAARQQETADSLPLRPSYSASDLADLRLSNVSTPEDLLAEHKSTTTEGGSTSQALDIASKFGPLVTTKDEAYIPSEAEIREKKERRARLAAEHKAGVDRSAEQEDGYIALDDAGLQDFEHRRRAHRQPSEEYDELKDRVIVRQRPTTDKPDRLAETRLLRDDEEIAEGFEAYTEDTPLALSRKSQKEATKKRRQEIAEAIAAAQGGGATVVLDEYAEGIQDLSLATREDDISDGEAARNAAFEAAQQRAAGATSAPTTNNSNTRTQIPAKITPIPTMSSVLARLRTQLSERQAKEAAARYRLSQIQIEKKDVAEREVFVQAQLKEVGEKYEKLRSEAGLAVTENGLGSEGSTPGLIGMGRGLDSIGGTPVAARGVED